MTLRSELRLPDLGEKFRKMWTKNQKIAARASTTLTPEDFARRVVDENFAHLID